MHGGEMKSLMAAAYKWGRPIALVIYRRAERAQICDKEVCDEKKDVHVVCVYEEKDGWRPKCIAGDKELALRAVPRAHVYYYVADDETEEKKARGFKGFLKVIEQINKEA